MKTSAWKEDETNKNNNFAWEKVEKNKNNNF